MTPSLKPTAALAAYLFLFTSSCTHEAVISESAKPTPKTATGKSAEGQAPATFKVKFTTTVGNFTVEATRAWSPRGADRFHELVTGGFFTEIAFFRVIPRFMAQFGIHGEPAVAAKWKERRIPDDPRAGISNTRGTMSFATAGKDTRTTQMFINFKNNGRSLDSGFTPFAKVVEGMDVVDKIYKVGEGAPRGPGPAQGTVQSRGNRYLKDAYPSIDYIKSAKLID